ncbi:hypothetical protein HY620_01755 [Candidatus Uhrbacteria bacterium]|nr:hypothetical protein [Candidatus Uhrbacteria bacterium]
MKQKIHLLISKVSIFSIVSSLVLYSLVPLAANAANFTNVKDVLTRLKDNTAAQHTFTITYPAAFTGGEILLLDLSQATTAWQSQATTSWDTGDISVSGDVQGAFSENTTFGTATNASPSPSTLGSFTCTTDTNGYVAYSIVQTSTPTNPLLGIKRCGSSGGTDVTLTVTVSTGFTNPDITSNESELISVLNYASGATLGTTAPEYESTLAVPIVLDDEVDTSGAVTAAMSFYVGAATDANCSGTFNTTTADTSVALGQIGNGSTANPFAVSNVASVFTGVTPNAICTRLDTNAQDGATVQVFSVNAGLKSTAEDTSVIVNNDGDNSTYQTEDSQVATSQDNEFYGLCVIEIGAGSTVGGTAPTLTIDGTFAGANGGNVTSVQSNCTEAATASGSNYTGQLSDDAQTIWSTNKASYQSYAEILVKAGADLAVSGGTRNSGNGQYTPSVGDLADQIRFIATGTF